MHEINIAERVLREARNAGAEKFFRVEIGELCEITKEELENGLKMVTEVAVVENFNSLGSVVLQKSGDFRDKVDLRFGNEEIKFKVDLIESKIKCKCGFIGRAEILDRGHGFCVWSCPSCGLSGRNVEVLGGGEIKVVEVE